jgi:Brp/Blh family beta-carotene 15,15'-monooxygenase
MPVFVKYLLFISFLGIWISQLFSEKVLILLGYLLILTFGIIHGANDIALLKKNNTLVVKSNIKLNILIIYVLSISFFCVIFYLIPFLGLLIFICFSCYHFGEQHVNFKKSNESSNAVFLMRFTYGLFILMLLLLFHSDEVVAIIANMTSIILNENILLTTLLIAAVILLFLYFYCRKMFEDGFDPAFELFLLVIFGLIFKFTPLIWGFALYFIIWHSIPSIKSQCEFLYGDFSFRTLLNYLKSGLLIWCISIIGLAIFYFYLKDTIIIETLLFSFIAAITFPHVLTIYFLFNKKTE